VEFVGYVLSFLAGSGITGAAMTWAANRDEKKRDRRGLTADAARDVLGELDALYRSVARDATSDEEITATEARASAEIDKCGDEGLSSNFDLWVAFGRRFASGDLDAGEEQYQELFDTVREGLRNSVQDLS
jgi:hypothetical protein